MIRYLLIMVGFISFLTVLVYLFFLLQFSINFVRVSIKEKKFNYPAFKELLTITFLAQYGYYIVARNRAEVTGKSDMYFDNKTRNTFIVLSLLTLLYAVMYLTSFSFGGA